MLLTEPIRWTLLIWLMVLGGCIGSFLNVVVYRLPRGQSLLYPGSRCPRCSHAVRWQHNLPIVGWLMLRGRCHDCGEPIAARYPIVEAIVAFWFVALAWYGPLWEDGFQLVQAQWWLGTWETQSSLWTIYVGHLFLCCALLCLTLIDWDNAADRGAHYPIGLWGSALLAGVLMPTVHVALFANETVGKFLCVTCGLGLEVENIGRYGLLLDITGAIVGLALAAAMFWVWRGFNTQGAWHGLAHLLLVGAFLGVEAMLAVAVPSAFAGVAARLASRKPLPNPGPIRWASSVMLVAVTVCMLIWKH